MIPALVLSVALAAQPNLFEPGEMSSETIFATVAVCMDKAMNNGMTSTQAVPMCGCMVDAVRLNTKKGLRPPQNDATPDQMARCHAEMDQRGKDTKKKPGKTGT